MPRLPALLAILIALAVTACAREDRRGPRVSDVFSETMSRDGLETAVTQYRTQRAGGFREARESEADTNRLGYALLKKGDTAAAIRVFALNVETHPGSANVHDSLGEAYLAAGDRASAITSYRRALAIAPRKKSATAMLYSLTGERRPLPPLLLVHIGAGLVGVLSGVAAITLRKGSRPHARAGNVFVVAMLVMSALGALLAWRAPDGDPINVLMGGFTFYLVATSWWTARRRAAATDAFDRGALLLALALVAGYVERGVGAASGRVGTSVPAGLYFFFGALALLAAGLDMRMIARGGLTGVPRLVRHLWRMCTALLIAVSSLFLGQPQVFPPALRGTGLLALPSLAVLAVLVYWQVRVRSARRTPTGATGLGHLSGSALPS